MFLSVSHVGLRELSQIIRFGHGGLRPLQNHCSLHSACNLFFLLLLLFLFLCFFCLFYFFFLRWSFPPQDRMAWNSPQNPMLVSTLYQSCSLGLSRAEMCYPIKLQISYYCPCFIVLSRNAWRNNLHKISAVDKDTGSSVSKGGMSFSCSSISSSLKCILYSAPQIQNFAHAMWQFNKLRLHPQAFFFK